MKTLLPLAFVLAACGASTPSPSQTPSGPDITGKWKSACFATSDTQAATLSFDIQSADWKLDYVAYGDKTCATPFVTVHIEGPYTLTGKSSIDGAWEARFGFTKKTVTPHLDAAAGFLAQACGQGTYPVGQATDIFANGCAGLGSYPSAKCTADYDLVSLGGGTLHFGDRPKDNDMCTEDKRPKALSKVALTRT